MWLEMWNSHEIYMEVYKSISLLTILIALLYTPTKYSNSYLRETVHVSLCHNIEH